MTDKELQRIQNLCQGRELPEIRKAICGKRIGMGSSRKVYVLKQNPEYVVKIERYTAYGDFTNVMEWRNWLNYKDWKFLGPWLAPCATINVTGTVLIQRRVEFRARKFYPKYIPAFFTDLKLQNFGFIGDQFVCIDYPYFPLQTGKKTMQYAKWWNAQKRQP